MTPSKWDVPNLLFDEEKMGFPSAMGERFLSDKSQTRAREKTWWRKCQILRLKPRWISRSNEGEGFTPTKKPWTCEAFFLEFFEEEHERKEEEKMDQKKRKKSSH
ncbi:hypothetical protein Salat_1940200 [Sesamum alatum]|uniref:Uncharacterized protein n=1 Tax=Sesamum alatum TaxID=300844 RepID=A0AAE2CIU7_9LAMI|nr:hypothetical protein Salat_1940200 [Sesamum alatum]